jgi:hypothetical protein
MAAGARNVVGSVGSGGPALSLDVTLGAISGCGAGTQVTIRAFTGGGTFANNDIWININ